VTDLSNVICGPTVCAPELDGVVVYRDSNHLTARFAARLAPILAERIDEALRQRPHPP
jgi:hypothetical protein